MGANTVLAFAGDLSIKASGIVMLIAAARLLPVSEFATLSVAIAAMSVFMPLLDFGTSTLIARDGAASPDHRGSLFFSSLRLRAPIAFAALIGALLFALVKGGYYELAPLTVAAAALGALVVGGGAVVRSAENFGIETLQRFVASLITLGLSIFLMVTWHNALSVVVATTVASAVTFPLYMKPLRAVSKRAWLPVRHSLQSAFPYAYMTVGTLLYYRTGTFVVALFDGSAEVGSYTVAATSVVGMLMVPNAIIGGLLPRLSRTHCEGGDHRREVKRALRWSVAATTAVGAGAMIICPMLLPLIYGDKPEYAQSLGLVYILLPTVVLTAISGVLATLLIACGRRKPVIFQITVTLITNAALAMVLVAFFGPVGAALATVVAELVAVGLLFVPARQLLRRS